MTAQTPEGMTFEQLLDEIKQQQWCADIAARAACELLRSGENDLVAFVAARELAKAADMHEQLAAGYVQQLQELVKS